MSFENVDRRTFLKLGIASAAAAAISPPARPGSIRAKGMLTCPPVLTDMASDRLTYRLRDLFNCPVAMNEFGYAQTAKSVSAITAISFPPYACCGVPETAWSPGFLLTCEVFLNGRFLDSHLASFDPAARLEGVRYQGSLYTVTKHGAHRQKA